MDATNLSIEQSTHSVSSEPLVFVFNSNSVSLTRTNFLTIINSDFRTHRHHAPSFGCDTRGRAAEGCPHPT